MAAATARRRRERPRHVGDAPRPPRHVAASPSSVSRIRRRLFGPLGIHGGRVAFLRNHPPATSISLRYTVHAGSHVDHDRGNSAPRNDGHSTCPSYLAAVSSSSSRGCGYSRVQHVTPGRSEPESDAWTRCKGRAVGPGIPVPSMDPSSIEPYHRTAPRPGDAPSSTPRLDVTRSPAALPPPFLPIPRIPMPRPHARASRFQQPDCLANPQNGLDGMALHQPPPLGRRAPPSPFGPCICLPFCKLPPRLPLCVRRRVIYEQMVRAWRADLSHHLCQCNRRRFASRNDSTNRRCTAQRRRVSRPTTPPSSRPRLGRGNVVAERLLYTNMRTSAAQPGSKDSPVRRDCRAQIPHQSPQPQLNNHCTFVRALVLDLTSVGGASRGAQQKQYRRRRPIDGQLVALRLIRRRHPTRCIPDVLLSSIERRPCNCFLPSVPGGHFFLAANGTRHGRECGTAYRPGLQSEPSESTVKGECISEMEGYSDILTGSDYTPAGPPSCGSAMCAIFLPYVENSGTQKGHSTGPRSNGNSPLYPGWSVST
ncbi:hypothetical protein K505DRAFT_422801 [Melanomma pulvis-pyrius CBS 109.77]|uniref:Uncharacterized protein n=1 Tax=Melanomma pulvis-pyrius CBS 109.77 TaxID=1314802 RepID=A0A6A6WP24_9PLEO|nr:hypothetical protein K505DRAFT_422801 [Melanomma pulvis-pyrius CBS 109.77]